MSVIAPPESPPEVQSPYDHGFTARAPRVSSYRRWTRAQQGAQVTIVAVAAAVIAAGGVLTGGEWGASAIEAVALFAAVVVLGGAASTLIERGDVRDQVAGAEPLPDGAIEVGARRLPDVRFLLVGAAVGAAVVLLDVAIGAGDIATMVGVVAGVCGGQVLSLEILLRVVVERSEPGREFFIELDPEPAPWEPPLLWRPVIAEP